MKYLLSDLFGNVVENTGRDINQILTQYRYFNDKDVIVSTDRSESYRIEMDRQNKTITLKSVNSDRAIKYMKDSYGKYEEVA